MKFIVSLFTLLLTGSSAFAQYAEVSGTLKLDTSMWAKTIYISRISDFNLMYTSSHHLIIAEGNINKDGSFKIQIPTTKSESLFRLHFVRKDDPVSTLIIGGDDENHAFFIAKDSDLVNIQSNDTNKIIQQLNIYGNQANKELNKLFTLLNNDTLDREITKDSLLNIADESGSQLVSLLSIQKTYGLNNIQKKRIKNILNHFDKENLYGSRIFKEYEDTSNWTIYLLAGLILAIIAILLGVKALKKRSDLKIRLSLSQRETHIVQLIIANKTNKEIAEELNIELSTVKTHVNNIFSKLKLSNRKELLKYKHIFST